MAIKNSNITKNAGYYLEKIQSALVKHGAAGIQMLFDNDGRISAMSFALPKPDGNGVISFQLPCQWRKFQQVIKSDGNKRWQEDEYCYRVAWANIKDWVESQMALYETEMVTMPQVFLPFATTKDGRTLAEVIASGSNLLLE